MKNLKITHSYQSLKQAGALLGVSANELIHAGAFNQVQICVNFYGRANDVSMERIETDIDGDHTKFNPETIEKRQAVDGLFSDWIDRLKINVMPVGVYEVTQEDLRLFEMPKNKGIELEEAYKSDDLGLWEVSFKSLVKTKRSDLIMLTTEIDRIEKSGGINSTVIVKPSTTEDTTEDTTKVSTYLNIIAALLYQLTSGKANDTSVINQIAIDFQDKKNAGLSERTLQRVFARAKRSLGAS